MTLTLDRRTLLLSAMAAPPLALAGCNPAQSPQDSGTLRMTWWGNKLRDEMTNEALDLYEEQSPGLTIERESSDFTGYWDKLATQTAGGDPRDIMQFGDGYLSEYASRGALLDLEPHVDLPGLTADLLDTGRLDGALYGINAGINVPTLFCNLRVLEDAGVERPDDTTWTWEEFQELCAVISGATGDGTYGTDNIFLEGTLRAFIRHHDEELFTPEGELGVSAQTLREYFEMQVSFRDAEAIPPASVVTENAGKPLEQSPVATGDSAFALLWSNQNEAISQATEDEIALLRMPTITGTPEGMNAWYHPSMLLTASAKTANPEAVGQLISWWITSVDCAEICRDERGLPASEDIVESIADLLSPAGLETATFIKDLEPVLGDPQPIPPNGASTVFQDTLPRIVSDLLFESLDASQAAEQFLSEAEAALT